MILTCSGCGACGSFELFTTDADAKKAAAKISTFPQPTAAAIPAYLGLFRPETRNLSWRKANSLLDALHALVSVGYVQVKGRSDRDCPPAIWAQAMDDMVARRERINRPLPNHNYLRQVAHDLAGMADAAGERTRVAAEQSHQRPNCHENGGPVRIASISPLAKLMED